MPEIVGRLRTPRLASAPASPAYGEMYFDTAASKLFFWNGTAWTQTGGGSGMTWVPALSATPVLDGGLSGQIRAGRRLALADFTAMGLSAPAGLWNLGLADGGGGSTATDASGNGRPLTNRGSNVNGGGVGILGVSNTSAGFTGNTTQTLYRADTGSADPFRITTGSWGCWARSSALGQFQGLVSKAGAWAAATANYHLLINNTNFVRMIVSDGTNFYDYSGTTFVCDNRWHFIVATSDGTAARLYVDGALDAFGPVALAQSYAGTVNVGSRSGDGSTANADSFYGYVSDAFITPDVLSEDQVRFLYCTRIPHTLGKIPTAVSLNVRRQRKGGPLPVTDPASFRNQPVRLYNFTNGSAADQGYNAVPLNTVASRVGAPSSGYASSPRLSGAGSGSITIPAAGVPAGSTIILFGYQLTASPLTVSDTKGNAWTHRAGNGSAGIVLYDCQVTTALVSGDRITLATGAGGSAFIFQVAWYTRCYFDTMAQGTFSGTAAAGPTITTKAGGGPVLGVFGIYNGANGSPTPSLGSSGQGAGYGVETTTFTSDFSTTPYEVHSLCWESKIGAGGVAETATGTLNDGGTQRFGATVAYTALPNPGPGADGARNGGVVFNGSLSLYATDAGMPTPGFMCYGCWMKTSKLAVMGVMGWAGASGNGERIITLSDGTLRFDEGSLTTQGPFIADGQWHFVVSVVNNGDVGGYRKFYVDGKLVGSTANYGSVSLGGATGFRIGAVQDGTSPFTGQIDGVFVCDYAIDAITIVALYARGSQPLMTASKDSGEHIEEIDASNIYAIFNTLDSQHQIDMAVSG